MAELVACPCILVTSHKAFLLGSNCRLAGGDEADRENLERFRRSSQGSDPSLLMSERTVSDVAQYSLQSRLW